MKTLLNFKKFVDELMESGSTLYKREVLEKYKDDEDVKFMLKYIFDPYIVNGISTRKLSKKIDDIPEVDISSKQVLNTIVEMRTGSDDAIRLVKGFMRKLKADEKQLFVKIVSKNLPLGIGTTTINKVMQNLIPTFNVMLAEKYESNVDYVEGKEFTLTKKIDGGRIVMLKDEGGVKFYTRSGQLYEGLVELEKEAELLPDNIMLDGEIIIIISKGLDSKEQYKRTMKIIKKDGIKTGVKMLVFDIMPLEDFYLESCSIPYKQRRQTLENTLKSMPFTFFELLPALYQGSDLNSVETVLQEQLKLGEEGVMLNINDAPYTFGRTKDLLKVKKMQDVDLTVTGLQVGENRNADKLGAFLVEYKGHQVKVGSGIDLETRIEVWKNPQDYIGRVIKVQYFEETTNQQGGVSLRFPVFLGFRDDKEGDY